MKEIILDGAIIIPYIVQLFNIHKHATVHLHTKKWTCHFYCQ